MVRLVTAKGIGVEGGSATPSSTPTPKVNTWEQVEERQQRNRGIPKAPVKPVVQTAEAGKTPPTGAPKPPTPEIKGEIPKVGTALGKVAKAYSPMALEDGINFTKARFQGFTPRPVGTGRNAPPPLNPAQKLTNSVLETVNSYGDINPLSPLKGGKGSKAMFALMQGLAAFGMAQTAGKTVEGGEEALIKMFEDAGYTNDAAQDMLFDFKAKYGVASAAGGLAAEAAGDATFMVASAAAGATIGAMFFGIGAVPGAILGAGYGWAAGRVAAGASTLLNMVEMAATVAKADGEVVNIPTIDDYWLHGMFREWNAEGAFNAAQLGAAETLRLHNLNDPGRFLSDEETVKEQERILNGYYADSIDVDPKYDDYKKFISEGYFVSRNAQGEYQVDVLAVQTFLYNTARMTREADLRTRLPKITPAGKSFAARGKELSDLELAGLWYYDPSYDIAPMP